MIELKQFPLEQSSGEKAQKHDNIIPFKKNNDPEKVYFYLHRLVYDFMDMREMHHQ